MADVTAYLGPDALWLVDQLRGDARADRDPADVLAHAERILVAVKLLRARGQERRHREIEREIGPAKEIQALRKAAKQTIKTKDNEGFMRAWAATSAPTRALIWAGHGKRLAPTAMSFAFQQGRHRTHMLASQPLDAVLLLNEAEDRLRAERTRKPDALVDNLFAAIRDAVVQLTGTAKPTVIDSLIRDVDSHFKLGVAYTADSPRIRRHISAAKPVAKTQ
jgi:hypothetical protein